MIKVDDERLLLDRLKAGDHAAFEQIYHLYKIRLIANLLKLLKSRELAEEVLQDLFLKIWEQRERIDPSQSLNAYLYKVANNMVYDTFRKIARDKKLHEHLLSNSNIRYDHIEKALFKKENQEELNKAIMLMPLQQQTVFKLCKIEEKSYQEVSELLNIKVGTINNHIYRANVFLKNHFSSKASATSLTIVLSLLLDGIK